MALLTKGLTLEDDYRRVVSCKHEELERCIGTEFYLAGLCLNALTASSMKNTLKSICIHTNYVMNILAQCDKPSQYHGAAGQ